MYFTKLTFCLLAAALVVGGCKDERRPLSYEKGVYGGKKDTALTSEKLHALRHRGGHQKD